MQKARARLLNLLVGKPMVQHTEGFYKVIVNGECVGEVDDYRAAERLGDALAGSYIIEKTKPAPKSDSEIRFSLLELE